MDVQTTFPSSWKRIQQEADSLNRLGELQHRSRGFADFLFPAGLPYTITPATIFLLDQWDKISRSTREFIARDGALALEYFFSVVPAPPPEFAGRLFVHVSGESCIPRAWLGRAGIYQYGATGERFVPSSCTKLLFFGTAIPECGDSKNLLSVLDSLAAREDGISSRAEAIAICLSESQHPCNADLGYGYTFEILTLLKKHFGDRLNVMPLRELLAATSLREYVAVDLDRGGLCADSFLTHFVGGRGADLADAPLLIPKSPVTARFLETEPGYGFELRSCSVERSSEEKGSMRRSGERVLPWHRWLSTTQSSLKFSPWSGEPVSIDDHGKTYQVRAIGNDGHVDRTFVDRGGRIVFEGWCLDQVGCRNPERVVAFVDRQPAAFTVFEEMSKKHVLNEYRTEKASLVHGGFRAILPPITLGDSPTPIGLYGLHERGFACELGRFLLRGDELVALPPGPNLARPEHFEIRHEGIVANLGTGFQERYFRFPDGRESCLSYLDSCKVDRGKVFLCGWILDSLALRPADFVTVFVGIKCVAVYKVGESRPHLVRQFARKDVEAAGFYGEVAHPDLHADSPLRLYGLWSSGEALELSQTK